jgi:predicted Ser/Thr protein kinase
VQTLVQCKKCGKSYSAGVVNKDFQGVCPNCIAAFAMDDMLMSPLDAPPPDTDRTTVYLAPGTVFQGLEIQAVIGQGGMGVVYRARQTSLDRLVAVKVMSDRLAGDSDFVRRFEKEARAMAALSHPNIVAVYSYGIDAGRCFIVMEHVDGVNLRQVIRDRKLMPEEALRIVPQLCDALDYAHTEGVVHRDIKPENILLDKKGRVKITDFGLAKMAAPGAKDKTMTGLVMGTPHYMAPEQVETPKDVDHRADIYSMGVVFYELLTGELPIGRFAPPSHRGPVDVRLDQVVLKALEKRPEARYQRAGEMRTDVTRVSDAIPMARLASHPPAAAAAAAGSVSSPATPGLAFPAGFAAGTPVKGGVSGWAGTSFAFSIVSLVLAFAMVLVSVAANPGDEDAYTASIVLLVIAGAFGFLSLLTGGIGFFDILFSGGARRGFAFVLMAFALDATVGVASAGLMLFKPEPQPGALGLRSPLATVDPDDLVSGPTYIVTGYSISRDIRYERPNEAERFRAAVGDVPSPLKAGRLVTYESQDRKLAFDVVIVEFIGGLVPAEVDRAFPQDKRYAVAEIDNVAVIIRPKGGAVLLEGAGVGKMVDTLRQRWTEKVRGTPTLR